MVKVGQTHRRHDAGEARDGGAMRKRATGHGRGRAWARWRALAPARRTVVVAVPGVACTDEATTVEAAGARLSSGSRLQRLRRCGVGTYGFYAVR